MSDERSIRLQFLDEAEDYIATLETQILAAAPQGHLTAPALDAMLRAAHSLKGGAAMMGYDVLSDLSHRLEDNLKVIRTRVIVIDSELEPLLLGSIDCLRQGVAYYRLEVGEVDPTWLAATAHPVFEQIRDRVGDPQPEDHAALLSEDTGEDMVQILFQTEVEHCLQRLEGVLASADRPCLQEEFVLAAQELGGLGEMLDLSAFSQLSASIESHLVGVAEEKLVPLAQSALAAWRRSQALIMIDQIPSLPTELKVELREAEEINPVIIDEPESITSTSDNIAVIEEDLPTIHPRFDADQWQPIATVGQVKERVEPESLAFLSELLEEPVAPILSSRSELSTATLSALTEVEADAPTPAAPEESIRVPLRQLETLSDLFGELTIERNGLNLQVKALRHLMSVLGQRVKSLDRSHRDLRNFYDQSQQRPLVVDSGRVMVTEGLSAIATAADFDQLEMDHYSDIHPQLQELMETIVRIQEVTGDLDINLDQTQRTARDITQTSQRMQTQLTQVRMRPFGDLANRFPRALRDLCLKYGKSVELQINGGNTLIDRTILDVLGDPLLHLLRNAFDHGIEDPQTRQALGKSPQGQIELTATYRGNQTVITLRDDGSGINLAKIREKAIAMGFDPTDLDGAKPGEILDLIFEPGFSTVEQVSELSGRGVGMDIVRTQLQKVQGQIQVETEPGVGTTFTLILPFTLSVIRVLLVESAGLLLAFPTNDIEEMIVADPAMVRQQAGQEILDWEGLKVRLLRLREWFPFARSYPPVDREALPIISTPTVLVIAQGDALVGLEVDRFWGEQEVTIRAIEGRLPMPQGFTGCTILGDGRVAPLIDASALLRWIEQERRGQSQIRSQFPHPAVIPEQPSLPTLMVVDDSINVRRFVAATLEKAGYRVQQAKDGQDALEKLGQDSSVQLIICDIEMPRLDGYGFLAQVKAQEDYRQIPVIMLTSRSGSKHQQIARSLGAAGYFSKPFQEAELLATIHHLITPAPIPII